MSAKTSICPKCATPLPRDAPMGLCPECLLRGGFADGDPAESSSSPGPPRERTIHIVVPLDEPGGAVPETLRYFGDYELLEQIAVGGMGVVFKARQVSLNRLVAVKMIRAGQLARADDIRRFRTEAEAAANLKHPHIVAIHEVGEHEGRHFFSMDYIEGRSLAELVRDHPLEPDRAARLVQTIAEAIAYAHGRGVLHRDLKPSNVMMNAQDEPHVMDFGLAKLFDVAQASAPASSGGVPAARSDSGRGRPENPQARTPAPPELTQTGAVMGSPSYMSPEQARGRGDQISVRTDVYALGAMLYELLTARPPFLAASALETMKLVAECDPVAPRVLNPSAPRDLETICLKCLQKEPAHRYASADALAEDLERWQRHEPIAARPSTAWERGVKWARRHPARAGLLTVTILAPSILAAVLFISSAQIRRERNKAWGQERRAVTAQSLAETERVRAEESERSARERAYATDIYAAFQALEEDDFAFACQIVEGYLPNPSSRSRLGDPATNQLLGFEWRLLWQRTRGDYACALTNPGSPALCLAFSPDGRTVLAGGDDGINQWILPEGKWIGRFSPTQKSKPTNSISRVNSIFFIERGPRILVAGDDSVACWSYPEGVFQYSLPERHAEMSLSGDGTTLAVGIWNDEADSPAKSAHPFSVVLYDLRDQSAKKVLPGYGHKVAISPDGQWVMAGSRSNGVVLWHPATDRQIKIKSEHGRGAMSFSPDSHFLVFGGWQSSIHVREIETRRPWISFTGYPLGVHALLWTPDGANILSVGLDQTIKLWRVPPWQTNRASAVMLPDRSDLPPQRAFSGHRAPVSTLALSRDGKWVASGSLDRTILLWPRESLMARENPVVLPRGRSNRHLDPVSGCIVTYSNTALAVWSPALPDTPARPLPGTEDMLHVGSLRSGNNFAAIHPGRREQPFRLEIHGLPDGRLRSRLEILELNAPPETSTNSRIQAAISPDGHWLAVVRSESCSIYNLSERRMHPDSSRFLHPSNGIVQRILFSPDSQWLVLTQDAPDDSSITVIDVSSWKARSLLKLAGEPDSTTAANIDPTGRYLATGGGRQNSIRIWELSTGRLLGRCNGNVVQNGMVWSPDAQTLATVGSLGLKLWNTRFYRSLANLEHRSGYIPCGFTADGRSLISCTELGQIRCDTAPSLEEIFATRHP